MGDEQSGFALYVQNLRRKMGGRRAFGSSAYEAAMPGWQRLRQEEKQLWSNRAHELQRTQYAHRPRFNFTNWGVDDQQPHPHVHAQHAQEQWGRRPQPYSNVRDRLNAALGVREEEKMECFEVDDEDEWGMGAPEIQPSGDSDEAVIEKMLNEKYERDRKRMVEMVLAKTDGCKEKIKKIRYLMVSAQTFGIVDDICRMGEVAMTEFDFTDGMLDTFGSLVGPWDVHNEVQKSRAMFHSNETHGIPLDVKPHIDKSTLLMEILGRTEPHLALQQGVSVGLYRNEKSEKECARAYTLLEHRPHRRFLLCLRQEYREIQAAFEYLKKDVGLDYEGCPVNETDFILVDSFVDAIASILGGDAIKEYKGWLKALGTTLPTDFSTPWERHSELFCIRHRSDRNSCCANVTVGRASYIVLYALEELLK